jgi:hypothetical protein
MHQMAPQAGLSGQRPDAGKSSGGRRGETRRDRRLSLVTGSPRPARTWGVGGDGVEPAVPEAVAPQPHGRLAGAEQLRRAVHRAPRGELQEYATATRDPRRGAGCRHPTLEMLALELAENDGQGPRGRHVVDPPGGEAGRSRERRPARRCTHLPAVPAGRDFLWIRRQLTRPTPTSDRTKPHHHRVHTVRDLTTPIACPSAGGSPPSRRSPPSR